MALGGAFAAWGGEARACAGADECAAASARGAAQYVQCVAFPAGGAAGGAAGRFCVCASFRSGEDCSEVESPLAARGASDVLLLLVLARAAWTALVGLRAAWSERHQIASTAVVCLLINLVFNAVFTAYLFELITQRLVSGAGLMARELLLASISLSAGVTFSLGLYVVFEAVLAGSQREQLRLRFWFAAVAVASLTVTSIFLLAKSSTLRFGTVLLFSVSSGWLYFRAAHRVRKLFKFSENVVHDEQVAAAARRTDRFIRHTARILFVTLLSLAPQALFSANALVSPPAKVFALWFCDWLFHAATAQWISRGATFLSAPFRKRQSARSARKIGSVTHAATHAATFAASTCATAPPALEPKAIAALDVPHASPEPARALEL